MLNSWYIREIEIKKQIYRQEIQWQEYKETLPNNTLDYAIFGDSHTRDALNPKYIKNSFNFASSGEDYRETYFRVKKLVDDVNINNFILQIDLHQFSESLRTDERLFRDKYFWKNYLSISKKSEMRNEPILITALNLNSHLLILGKGHNIFSTPDDKLTQMFMGWTNSTRFEKNISHNAQKRIKAHFDYEKAIVHNESFNYFMKILKLAKNNSIDLIFISLPVTIEYEIEANNLGIFREEFKEIIFQKITNASKEYRFFDFHDKFFSNNSYFRDSDHLNYNGSTIISKVLKEKI